MEKPFYHIGIVVRDLDVAIPRFSETFEITFNEPSVMPVRVEGPDSEGYDHEIRVTYSKDGPPFIELMEGHDTRFPSLAHGEGVHHVGLWVPPGTADSPAERFRQLHVDARVSTGGSVLVHTAPEMLHGVRLELVDESTRVGLLTWVTGRPPE